MLEAYKISWLRTFESKTRMKKDVYKKAMLMHFLTTFVPCMIMVMLEIENVIFGIFAFIFVFSMFPVISCTIQRLHDIGKTGWYLLLCVILGFVVIGWVMLGANLGKESIACDNRWGTYMEPQAMDHGQGFVDNRMTEQDLKNDRKKLGWVLLKIFLIFVVIVIIGALFAFIEPMIAPYI